LWQTMTKRVTQDKGITSKNGMDVKCSPPSIPPLCDLAWSLIFSLFYPSLCVFFFSSFNSFFPTCPADPNEIPTSLGADKKG
jgi:hypothetical protein